MSQATPQIANHVLFYQIWQQCRIETCHPPCGGNFHACQPSPWVVTRLLELVSSEPARSIDALTPAIQKIIQDSRFVGSSGDLLADPPQMPPLEKQTNLIVTALKRMRSSNLFWDTIPAGH